MDEDVKVDVIVYVESPGSILVSVSIGCVVLLTTTEVASVWRLRVVVETGEVRLSAMRVPLPGRLED